LPHEDSAFSAPSIFAPQELQLVLHPAIVRVEPAISPATLSTARACLSLLLSNCHPPEIRLRSSPVEAGLPPLCGNPLATAHHPVYGRAFAPVKPNAEPPCRSEQANGSAGPGACTCRPLRPWPVNRLVRALTTPENGRTLAVGGRRQAAAHVGTFELKEWRWSA
jgi:hypothetical protein